MSALRGIRVLELSESVCGEYCGKLLADFGAEIIKIEKPGCGSPTRRFGPFAGNEAGDERSGLFAYLNTNKQSLALDCTASENRATLSALFARVDVVVDDHSLSFLQGLGLDPDTLANDYPGLVLCSISPYGLNPPDERRHAEDINVFHSSGWGYHTPSNAPVDQPPLSGAGRFMPSYEAGVEAAMCVAAALYDKQDSGLGQFIEIAMQEVLASRVDYVLGQMIAGDMDVSTERSAFDLFGPAGIFACQDGYAYIWMSAPAHWDGLRQLLGDPAWMASFPERWLERECTPERVAQCRLHIGEWLKTQNKHEVAEAAQKLGLILVAVNNAGDLMASPQYQFRKFFAELDHPVLGKVSYPTVPYKLSATPAALTSPAPLLGRHSAEQLAAWLSEQANTTEATK
ncbi:CaiB/BaiF CoA transferase family protein [Zhongshania sp.]|uniref:CaiB/BaiF CoA transferase family protein n=1 Tax=Zhongshania sp. TaxID=1971902 RepID=UPI0035637103